jgi:hypothetical protein
LNTQNLRAEGCIKLAFFGIERYPSQCWNENLAHSAGFLDILCFEKSVTLMRALDEMKRHMPSFI